MTPRTLDECIHARLVPAYLRGRIELTRERHYAIQKAGDLVAGFDFSRGSHCSSYDESALICFDRVISSIVYRRSPASTFDICASSGSAASASTGTGTGA